MRAWKLPWRTVRETPPPEEPTIPAAVDEQTARSTDVKLETIDEMGALCRELHTHLEVDEGVLVPVSLSENNASRIVEMTQRAREHREREMASVPRVYNFGSEPRWTGDE